jgi:hypothetical protein
MKRNQYILILFGFAILINACTKPSENIRRPPLPVDALRWVQINNKNPKFKHTWVDAQSKTHIDTVQGVYTLTHENKTETHETYVLYYERYTNVLSINSLGASNNAFVIDNYAENAYRGQVDYLDPYLSQNSILDTALVNGKLYSNVFKSSTLKRKYYYAKDIGFIFYNEEGHRVEITP